MQQQQLRVPHCRESLRRLLEPPPRELTMQFAVNNDLNCISVLAMEAWPEATKTQSLHSKMPAAQQVGADMVLKQGQRCAMSRAGSMTMVTAVVVGRLYS